ncbi:hypothetical protein D3C73_919980 [compost metagenome]
MLGDRRLGDRITVYRILLNRCDGVLDHRPKVGAVQELAHQVAGLELAVAVQRLDQQKAVAKGVDILAGYECFAAQTRHVRGERWVFVAFHRVESLGHQVEWQRRVLLLGLGLEAEHLHGRPLSVVSRDVFRFHGLQIDRNDEVEVDVVAEALGDPSAYRFDAALYVDLRLNWSVKLIDGRGHLGRLIAKQQDQCGRRAVSHLERHLHSRAVDRPGIVQLQRTENRKLQPDIQYACLESDRSGGQTVSPLDQSM